MRGARSWIVVASLAALAAACTDAPQAPQASFPSAPLRTTGELTAPSCAAATARTIYGEINTLLASKDQTQGRTFFRAVEAACAAGGAVAAKPKAIDYYRFFLTVHVAGRVRGSGLASAQHFENVAVYIGEPTQFVAAHFEAAATPAIRVCPDASNPADPCVVKTASNKAGISVPKAALPDGPGARDLPRLFSVAQVDPTTCLRENLEFVPNCFQFDVTPSLLQGQKFDQDVAVSVCVDDPAPHHSRVGDLRLAHPERGSTTRVQVAPDASFPGSGPPACGVEESANLNPTGDGLIGGWRRLGALAARGWSYLGPRTAYAVHAGVGGAVRELSPFGAVDPYVFAGTFDDLGAFPLGPFPAAFPATVEDERGSWTSSVNTPPGRITIVESLGDLGTAAGDHIVELNQGGGACDKSCPTLKLTGLLLANTGTQAENGEYEVKWSSVQSKETSKLAPIDLRDGGDAEAAKTIARLAYRTVGSANDLVAYGRNAAGDSVALVLGRWSTKMRNDIEVIVDLDANPRTFEVRSVSGLTRRPTDAALPLRLGFLQPATSLQRFVAEFKGIDAGILGLDNVAIRRLPDPTTGQ